MASRHLARSIAMQTLYEWDFNGKDDSTMEELIERNFKEFGPGLDNLEFVEALVYGVMKKCKKLDQIIEKTAPEWPIAQVAMVDRNILRLGIFELLFSDRDAVPPKVAINESIELAKSFGGETSGRFVNGVLGTIYREIGEPMKDYPKRGEKDEAEGTMEDGEGRMEDESDLDLPAGRQESEKLPAPSEAEGEIGNSEGNEGSEGADNSPSAPDILPEEGKE